VRRRPSPWGDRVERVRREARTVLLVARHPATPPLAKGLALAAAAYALSPIDLIPDAVPVLGWLDDLLLVPFLIWLALRLTPPAVVEECRRRAAETGDHPVMPFGTAWVLATWAIGLVVFVVLALRFL
jgi:uncharacterized membrane protein YkvA (DUF1232 family)